LIGRLLRVGTRSPADNRQLVEVGRQIKNPPDFGWVLPFPVSRMHYDAIAETGGTVTFGMPG